MNAKFTLYQKALQNTFEKHVMNTGGLAIKAGSSALAETVNTVYYWIDGALYSKAAAGIRLRRDSWDMTAVTQQCTACLSLAAAALEA